MKRMRKSPNKWRLWGVPCLQNLPIMIVAPPPPNCATGTLAPYSPTADMPWNRLRVQHLYRRFGFSAPEEVITAALAQPPSVCVSQLLDAAEQAPNLPLPVWANWDINTYGDFNTEALAQILEYSRSWITAMQTQPGKERITLFWQNHFVTLVGEYFCPSWMVAYHQLLQRYAMGNFREFVYEMGKTPAMLVFLNGVQNTRFQPNENYARELLELFTIGIDGGYTQDDIREAARALTGWNGFSSACAPIGFVPILHDSGVKTIFGRTGNWGYDELHDLIFTERAEAMATYICTKIYRHFVHPDEIDATIVAGLAQTLRDNDWELAPVFRQLFLSEHFFDAYVIGTQIKSPIDLLLGIVSELALPSNDDIGNYVYYGASQLNQMLLNPPDVRGWREDRAWVNTETLRKRWESFDFFLFNVYTNAPAWLTSFAQTLTTPSANDPAQVARAVVDFFVPKGLHTEEEYERATSVFKWEVPQNYYDSGEWNLTWTTVPAQVALLMRHISRLPEYQLS